MNKINSNEYNYVKKVFSNSSWLILSRFLNIFLGVLVSVFLNRYLGPEQKGVIAQASAISGFFSFIATFGLTDIVISQFSSEKKSSASTAISAFVIMFSGSIIALILALFTAKLLNVSSEIFLFVFINSLVFLPQFCSIYEYWFYCNSNSKRYAIYQTFIHFFFSISRLVGIYYEKELIFFVLITAIESILILFLSYFCYRINGIFFQGRYEFIFTKTKKMLQQAIPMVIMGLATTVYMKVDQIMVGYFIGNVDLGLYSLAVNLCEYWYFIPTIIHSSFLPILSEKFSNNDNYYEHLQKFAFVMSGIGYLAACGTFIFGKYFVILLYGSDFSETSDILIIYIWSGLFTCVGFSVYSYFILIKKTKYIMVINIFGAILNFFLNIIFINIYGGKGAAIATLTEYVLVTFLPMFFLWKKYSKIFLIELLALFPFLIFIKKRIRL